MQTYKVNIQYSPSVDMYADTEENINGQYDRDTDT